MITTDTAAAKIGRSMKKCEKRMACVPQRAPLGAPLGSPFEAPLGARLGAAAPLGSPLGSPGSDSVLFSPRETPVGNAVTCAFRHRHLCGPGARAARR